MSETKLTPDIEEYEIQEEEEEEQDEEGFEGLEDDLFEDIFEEEIQTELEDEGTVEVIPEKQPFLGKHAETYKLDKKAVAEIKTCHDPSYTNIKFPYNLVCEKRVTEGMKKVRALMKSEGMKMIAEQTSAFESVRIRRLYKTGVALPERIFVEHEKGYTFRERERLRYLLNNEIV